MKTGTAGETGTSQSDKIARLQRALAESEASAWKKVAELELLYRSLPIALAVFDRDMCFLRVSDEVSKVDGIPAAAHVGLLIWDVAPDFANAAEGYLRKVFQTGESISNVEMRGATLRHPDAVRDWLCSYYPYSGRMGSYRQPLSWPLTLRIENTRRRLYTFPRRGTATWWNTRSTEYPRSRGWLLSG